MNNVSEHHLNYASSGNYYIQFTINNEIYKYYNQSVKLPDIQFGSSQLYVDGCMVYLPAASMDAGNVDLDFIMDDDFKIYTDILDFQEVIAKNLKSTDICEVFILNNDSKAILKIELIDIFFTFVSGPLMSTTAVDTSITFTTTMNFNKFKYKRI